jgi:NAD(P)-dependent dehydrogenase (short-subunit alcohol dehydrogenase family)
MSNGLSGQVAVVSGAARGLGAAWVEALRTEGATVVGFDIRPGADVVADASSATDVRAFVDGVVAAHGTIDISIANAGVVRATSPLDPWDKALADFDAQIGTNLKGTYLLGRAVAPIMAQHGGGNIVHISTDHVLPPPGGRTGGGAVMDGYDASKWGIRGLTEAWARALAPHKIRVNDLCMGATDAPMPREFMGDRLTPEFAATWMKPADLARVLVELLLEGPDGRTGEQIGFWLGHDVRLPARHS